MKDNVHWKDIVLSVPTMDDEDDDDDDDVCALMTMSIMDLIRFIV